MIDFTVILIAITLALDCFAVSICISGINHKNINNIKVPLYFGFFQFFMTMLGFFIGISVIELIRSFDHWIAFTLLFFVGGKMIYESKDGECKTIKNLSEKTLLMLSIATSIDALIIGMTFGLIQPSSILFNSIIIGIVTFMISLFGLVIGKKLRCFNPHFIGILGGIVLMIIGINALI